ncbi:MAG: TetR/AcrR family transcriptional regulator [Sphingomonadales bacterium]|nr:TetR/AcrR family transcriptional regulator [Sphingomonadales bacterium]
MVTVSTLKSTSRGYHHGDLRSALIDAGMNALESAPLEDISLRQIAREVGVSATAVYRHFPDKRALLAAVAHEGFERLGAAQFAAAEATAPAMRFAASGRAYVRFALANPALFRLIFTYGEQFTDDNRDNLAARLLRAQTTEQRHGDPDEAERLSLQAWALVHGLAMLMLDGRVTADEALIDRVIDPATLFIAQPRPGSSNEESP